MEYSGSGRRSHLKLYHIVRLQHMVKQWRRAAQLSKKRLHHVLARSLSNSTLEYTLISSSSSSTTSKSSMHNNIVMPKKGYIAVYVGEERRRFVIPVRSLNHPVFDNLLQMAEEEFHFHYHSGGLTIPCDATFFEHFVLPLLLDQAGCHSTRASTSFTTTTTTINKKQAGHEIIGVAMN